VFLKTFSPECFGGKKKNNKKLNHQNKFLISVFCAGVCVLTGSTVNLRYDPRNAKKPLKQTEATGLPEHLSGEGQNSPEIRV